MYLCHTIGHAINWYYLHTISKGHVKLIALLNPSAQHTTTKNLDVYIGVSVT
jgi:hypothetical protein